MSWSLDTEKVDLGFVNPPVGRKRYKITSMASQVDKNEPSGKSQFILMKINDGKMTYTVSFYVMAKDETQERIAKQNLAKVANAVGIKGVLKPERLKSFIGKSAEFDFQPSKKDAKYINFQNAYPIEEDAEEPETEPEEEEEPEEEQEAEEQEEHEETPPPAVKKPPVWKRNKTS